MKKREDTKKDKAVQITARTDVPTIWVDNLNIGIRGDDICLLRFTTALPEGLVEQVKIMTSRERLRNFIDLLCSTIGYYPIEEGNKPGEGITH